MSRQLTARSSLEILKKEAKRWLKALRAHDAEARRRLEQAHPEAPPEPGLRDLQHALAREHGLESWAALRQQLDDAAIAGRSHAERVADFLELASLHYGVRPGTTTSDGDYDDTPERRQRAARILERHPEVGRASIHTAAVCGDLAEVQRILAIRPGAVSEKGGREGWEPLLFLSYGRLPVAAASEKAVEIARVLLDGGADPNVQWTYRWEQNLMTWSALCGVIGNGENGPMALPPHPMALELAALLLDRGADPNQGQALYNTMLRGDDARWLRLLIARGLHARHPISWEGPGSGNTIFEYLLNHAVATNQLERAAVLLEHGANPNPANGRSLYQVALLGGGLAMAELLVRHGALRTPLAGADEFRAACMRLDVEAARRLLEVHPEYLQEGGSMLIEQAAARNLAEVARLLLDLGVSPDVERTQGGYRALHQAACANAADVARVLIERGAAVDVRDAGNHATPLGWALHTHSPDTTELLGRHSRDVFTLVAGGLTGRLRELLEQDRGLANATVGEYLGLGIQAGDPGETPLFLLPDNEERALETAELLLAFGADPRRRNLAGQTPADKALARDLEDVADLLIPQGG